MSSRGPSSKNTASSTPPHIPSDISCLVLYEPLRPNYDKQPIRVGTDGGNKFWAPPNRKNAYLRDRVGARLFRWKGGTMTDITAGNLNKQRSPHGVATIFTQWRDTNHLLAVTFDAEKKDVAEEYGGWKVLSFDHVRIPQPGTQPTYYSSVVVAGEQQQLAAPGSPTWTPQLLPTIYDYDPKPNLPQPASAGLIGNLPLLFALPAFSAQPDQLTNVLTSFMQPNRWHRHELPHGRKSRRLNTANLVDRHKDESERGMVVTVFLDPSNKTGSTKHLLDLLQNGHFGPFYGP
ncbi:MAG: hypothetical protein Q9221_007042 [Calogaya cf. arnoldii]